MENPTNSCHGINPLCGDDITVYLEIDKTEGLIKDISFTGSGCAISKASTSLMTQFLKGKKIDQSRLIFDEFHKMVLGEFDPEKQEHHLGKLTLFKGIREYPSRTKCASLAWHTLVGALDKKAEDISTE
jgi:nitrogen fixation NifU-like protein